MQEERLQEARKEYKQLVENKAKKELEAQSSAEAKATAPPPIDDLVGTLCGPWHTLRHSAAACPIQSMPPATPRTPRVPQSHPFRVTTIPCTSHTSARHRGGARAAGPVWLATLLRMACSE